MHTRRAQEAVGREGLDDAGWLQSGNDIAGNSMQARFLCPRLPNTGSKPGVQHGVQPGFTAPTMKPRCGGAVDVIHARVESHLTRHLSHFFFAASCKLLNLGSSGNHVGPPGHGDHDHTRICQAAVPHPPDSVSRVTWRPLQISVRGAEAGKSACHIIPTPCLG